MAAPFRPALTSLEDRLLCSLLRVTNTRRFPFSAVAHVQVVYDTNLNRRADADDARAGASAVMIGRDTALTSAHVVYDGGLGGLAISVSIAPGQQGRFKPFGTFVASSWVVPSLYTRSNPAGIDTAADFAVLNFKPRQTSSGAVHVGDLTGWMTPRAFPDQTLRGLTVLNVGYPAQSFPGTVPFRSAGPILNSRERSGVGYFSYSNLDIPIEEGSSGSPLFRKIKGTGTILVGLTEATILGANVNLATKITPRVTSFIKTAQKVTEPGGHVVTFSYGSGGPLLPGFDARVISANVD
jgi:V8-like Glu-specific endopeptidase